MPLYLQPKRGGTNCSIAYCDRCRKKVYYDELEPDGDSPNLLVCKGCSDLLDPYKLPRRRNENISLKHPRVPDSVTLDDSNTLTTEYGDDILFPPNITVE